MLGEPPSGVIGYYLALTPGLTRSAGDEGMAQSRLREPGLPCGLVRDIPAQGDWFHSVAGKLRPCASWVLEALLIA